jgi:hypothetical protein
MKYVVRVIEKAVAEPATHDHTECSVVDELGDFVGADWQAALSRPASKNKAGENDAEKVRKTIPTNAYVIRETDDPGVETVYPVVSCRKAYEAKQVQKLTPAPR